jgi:hypothetical protein
LISALKLKYAEVLSNSLNFNLWRYNAAAKLSEDAAQLLADFIQRPAIRAQLQPLVVGLTDDACHVILHVAPSFLESLETKPDVASVNCQALVGGRPAGQEAQEQGAVGRGRAGTGQSRGLHSSTSQLNLNRFWSPKPQQASNFSTI